MKMATIIFREFLIEWTNRSRRITKDYRNNTTDEIWRDLSSDEKQHLKQLAPINDPEIDWLAIEDWLENQFREDVKKDPAEVAGMCIKKLKLSHKLIIPVASVSANARDEVLLDIATASDKEESS